MPKRLVKSLIKILRLEEAIGHIGRLTKKEERCLPIIFVSGDKNDPDPELKLKIYGILHELRNRVKRPFGALLVLGWRREWNRKHASIPDITQNIFRRRHFDLWERSRDDAHETIKKTIDFDGAILVTKDGAIVGSGIYLENIKPKEIAHILHAGSVDDLSTAFGFAKKVHTRHLAAIAASYVLKNTTIFVVSEEDRSLRVFENGKIIWSTISSEIHEIIEHEIESGN